MENRSLVFLKLLFLISYVSCGNENVSQKKKVGYIFTHPKVMREGGIAKACLILSNAPLPVKLTVKFTKTKCGDKKEETCGNSYEITKDRQCFELDVPKLPEENMRNMHDSLEIELDANGQIIKQNNIDGVSITSIQLRVFVETDRGMYKPEDLVRIRILAIEDDFTPRLNYTIDKATLHNPRGSKVKVWKNIPTTNGLAQLEYQLQDNAPTGHWRIEVDTTAGTYFKVDTYVLPRFKPTLEHPTEFYIEDKTFDIKVCAKYSYGRNVKGVGTIKATANGLATAPSINTSEKLKNGCCTINLRVEDLIFNRSVSLFGIHVLGSVTEQGTDETQTTSTEYIPVTHVPYYISFDYYTKLKPGLPYVGTLKIEGRKINLIGRKMNMCYKYKENWNYNFTVVECQDILIVDNEVITFTIPPLKRLTSDTIVVEYGRVHDDVNEMRNSYKQKMYLSSYYSASNNSLQIILDNRQKTRRCGDDVTFRVLYTLNNVTDHKIVFDYLFISRNDVVKTGHVNVKPKGQLFNPSKYENVFRSKNNFTEFGVPIDEFEIKLKLDDVYTEGTFVVFYETNGEIIADEIVVNIEQCLPNKVDIKWNKDTLEPAEKALLKISTGEGSLCALTSIDKASTFKSPPNAFTTKTIVKTTEYGRYYFVGWSGRNCVKSKEQLEEEARINSEVSTSPLTKPPQLGRYEAAYVGDTYDIFRLIHVEVISNHEFLTKPCIRVFYENRSPVIYSPYPLSWSMGKPFGGMATGGGGQVQDAPARTHFPETFIWDLVPAEQGHAVFKRDLPDSITNWVTKALCVSRTKGVGLSPSVELNVFKPFFVDVLLPYSIIRNTEIMHLPVAVFNYLNHSIPVRVMLRNNEDLELVDHNGKKTANLCVEAGDSATHIYRIKALKLGILNVSVSAELDSHFSGNCGSGNVMVKGDLVYKTVKVEVEGYPSDIVQNALLCANDSLGRSRVSWEINLPKDVVKDSVFGSVTINTDILGPIIENLDDWLWVPSGCGEQTMAALVPNLYILRYLKSNNALTKKVKAIALKNMEIGYQRILGYSHEDGSFSAFGKSDKEGCMFLTAFVVRSLRLMKEYITIQDDAIDKAVAWITQRQSSKGCFDSVSHIFQHMGTGYNKENQIAGLTSYIVISLRETKIYVSDDMMSKAKECISKAGKLDNYTLAISSYAFTLMDEPELADIGLKTLLEGADNGNDELSWQQAHSRSKAVEIAGYVLLALLQRGTPEYIIQAGFVVRFLQTQMNSHGGYCSTQDSAVALDGMSRFANIMYKRAPNLDIEVSTKQNGNTNIHIKKRDPNSNEKIPLTAYPEKIRIKVTGEGCVLGQAVVKFHINTKPKSESLNLTVSTKSASSKNQCSLLEVIPCVSYNAKGHSNMALLEVFMPSGYVPDQASLYALPGNVPDVKKSEVLQNRVVLYFNRLTSNVICTPFVIREVVVVENKVDPTVKLYDYYNPEVSVSQSFKLPFCETENAIEA